LAVNYTINILKIYSRIHLDQECKNGQKYNAMLVFVCECNVKIPQISYLRKGSKVEEVQKDETECHTVKFCSEEPTVDCLSIC
jgi:hypothetical protein